VGDTHVPGLLLFDESSVQAQNLLSSLPIDQLDLRNIIDGLMMNNVLGVIGQELLFRPDPRHKRSAIDYVSQKKRGLCPLFDLFDAPDQAFTVR